MRWIRFILLRIKLSFISKKEILYFNEISNSEIDLNDLIQWSKSNFRVPTPQFIKNSVFVTLSFIKHEDQIRPIEIFINSKDLNRWNGPFLINNLLYNISYFGELIINSPLNGEILTKENIGIKGLLTQPIILKDTIYISDEKSNVFQYK